MKKQGTEVIAKIGAAYVHAVHQIKVIKLRKCTK
jgi:hypothetical protein